MMEDPTALLLWAKGSGFYWAGSIFIAGLVIRLLEIGLLGRKPDLAVPRAHSPGSGWRTIFLRFGRFPVFNSRTLITYVAGYLFHVGLLIALFLLVPHIEIFKKIFGFGWPGLPTTVVDFGVVLALFAMIVLLIDRLTHPVKRHLSDWGDYLAWVATFLPLLTGYMTYHGIGLSYTEMLALHILSAELLLILLPFTRLSHAVTALIARWYTGDWFGRRGVKL